MNSLLWLHDNIRHHDNPAYDQAMAHSTPVALLLYAPEQKWPVALSDEVPRWQQARVLALQALAPKLPIIKVSNQSDISQAMATHHAQQVYADITSDYHVTQLQKQVSAKAIGNNWLLDIDNMEAKFHGRFSKFYYANRQHMQLLNAQPNFTRTAHNNRVPITENEALTWLVDYADNRQAILHYQDTRNNLLGDDGFSRLSAALSLGSLSVRHLAFYIDQYSEKGRKSVEQYLYELVWREYFQRLAVALGANLFSAAPKLSEHQEKALTAWCTAKTGIEIVDAGVTELTQTGFVSNRIRQLMASALVHDLDVPWQYGAQFFEQHLWDYHPSANYGNWAYIAGAPKISQKAHQFDITWQTNRYDGSGNYRKTYLSV